MGKAIKWYSKSEKQGNLKAQLALAELYYYGKGVDKDFRKSFELAMKSAKSGYANAQEFVAEIYLKGQAVLQDEVQAYAWLSLAVLNGSDAAIVARDRLGEELTRNEIAKGRKFVKKIQKEIEKNK